MDPIAERNDPSQHEAGGPGGQGSSGLGEARAELADAVEPMKKKAQSFAEQQRVVGAERIGDVAHAVHGAAEELEGRLPRVAGYIHDAAARLKRHVLVASRAQSRRAARCIQQIRPQPAGRRVWRCLAGRLRVLPLPEELGRSLARARATLRRRRPWVLFTVVR